MLHPPFPSNDIMCDAFHDGSGFLTHHLALTIGVEAAIRSVNPAVTMPYWDFTIEGEAIVQVRPLARLEMLSLALCRLTSSHINPPAMPSCRCAFCPAWKCVA